MGNAPLELPLEDGFSNDLERHPTIVQRDRLHHLQHFLTIGSTKPSQDAAPISIGRGTPLPPPLPERNLYVVDYESHDDPIHPQNWPTHRKIVISTNLIIISFAATLASSVLSPAFATIESEFDVGSEVATLATSLLVLGYVLGPIIFAPLSELLGRRVPVILATFGFGIFGIGCATAKDCQTLMICRFFAGVFGSCPLVVVPAVFADMFSNEVRGLAVSCFSATVFCGPFTGPLIGGFITKSYLGWRWTLYVPSILAFAAGTAAVLLQDESFPPIVLVAKAAELRRLTRNWGIHAKQEEKEIDLKELVTRNISRPPSMLWHEPILLLITLYVSFIYGLLFLSLTAYDIIFGDVFEFSPGVDGLPFLAAIVGIAVGLLIVISTNGLYVSKLHANNGIIVPEWRLPLVMVGGVLFPCGLFWLGWAGYNRDCHWIVPTAAGLFLGFGIYTIFLQCVNYIIDTYVAFAASAIAANTIVRSLVAAIFPLFADYMFRGLGMNWAMTLLGCVGVLFIPMPFILFFKGKYIRSKSKSVLHA